MPYRKIGYIEHLYHVCKCAIKNKIRKKRYPKIHSIYVDGQKRKDWTYNRDTGELEFSKAIPAGAKVEVVFRGKDK